MTVTTATAFGKRVPRGIWRDALATGAVVYLAWVCQYLMVTGTHVDVEAYWRAASAADPYAVSRAGEAGAYLYAPVIAQLLGLFGGAPLIVFVGGLLFLSLAAAVYLVGPVWSAAALLTPLPFFWQDLSSGNVHVVLAAAVVLGFRYPAAWTVVLLTKVTPGVGLLWFAFRGEWKTVGTVAALTALLAGVSVAAAPELWWRWLEVLRENSTTAHAGWFVPAPLIARLAVAVVLLWWGARRGHRWTVPLAAFIALPVLWIYDSFAMLLGVAGIVMRDMRSDES